MPEPLPDTAITAAENAIAKWIRGGADREIPRGLALTKVAQLALEAAAPALRAQGAATERARIRDNSTFVRGLKNGEDAYVVRADLLDGDGDG